MGQSSFHHITPKIPVPVVNNLIHSQNILSKTFWFLHVLGRVLRNRMFMVRGIYDSQFDVDLKSNFALKNNFMMFLFGQIMQRMM